MLKQGGIFKSDVFLNTLIGKYKKVKFPRKGVKLRPDAPSWYIALFGRLFHVWNLFIIRLHGVNRKVQDNGRKEF